MAAVFRSLLVYPTEDAIPQIARVFSPKSTVLSNFRNGLPVPHFYSPEKGNFRTQLAQNGRKVELVANESSLPSLQPLSPKKVLTFF